MEINDEAPKQLILKFIQIFHSDKPLWWWSHCDVNIPHLACSFLPLSAGGQSQLGHDANQPEKRHK